MNNGESASAVGTSLSLMMFLQFFIWGAWYVTVGQYMGAHGMSDQIFWAYTVGPIAAIVSPFFLGMVADRFFATERVLAVMHLLGGVVMFAAPWAATQSPWLFTGVLAVHMLCYMPTLGLTNSLAFHNITNQEKQFPIIRVFGTIGWIVAGLLVSLMLKADKGNEQFYITGGAAILLGVYSFFLPHTPPPAAGKAVSIREVLGLDALRQLSSFPFWVFLISSFLICIPLAAYYAYAPVYADALGFHDVAANMSIGQMAEIVFMLIMPIFFAFLGVKWMLLVGMLAWVLRYGLFALAAGDSGAMWMVLVGIGLHGICYDFFFVTGFIYTDKKSTTEIRGQAQGLLVLVTQGLGMLIGAQVIGWIVNGNKAETFDALTEQATALREQYTQAIEQGGDAAAQAGSLWDQATAFMMQTYDWGTIWLVPCVAAGAIALGFFLLFRDRTVNGGATEAAEEMADSPAELP